jgi:dTDP-4-amino-4,6-dideoxygalactose transaminase
LKVPLLDLATEYNQQAEQIEEAVLQVLRSGRWVLGPEVAQLERELANYCEATAVIGVSNGSDALVAALMAYNVGPGDEVITTPFTFYATVGAIARLGARPVFCDIDPRTYNIDAELISDAITESTKAIIPVDIYGLPAEMNRILALAKDQGLAVIEDAAQAIGAEIDGKRVGSLADATCFSFYPTKNLSSCGDAGAIAVKEHKLARELEAIRVHGSLERYYHYRLGGNFRIDEIQAAIIRVKFTLLEQNTEKRRAIAAAYNRKLDAAGLTGPKLGNGTALVLPYEPNGYRHVYHQYVIRLEQRDALMEHLHKKEVGAEVYYPLCLHRQGAFSDLGYREGDFPVAEKAAEQVLALPINPLMNDIQIDHVTQSICDFFRR